MPKVKKTKPVKKSKPVKRDLSRDKRKRFFHWARDVMDRMLLQNYTLYISMDPCSAELLAEMCLDEYRRVVIGLCPNWDNLSKELRRDAFVHEVCHVYVKLAKAPLEAAEDIIGLEAWAIMAENARYAEESVVTLLERVISPTMPLPPD